MIYQNQTHANNERLSFFILARLFFIQEFIHLTNMDSNQKTRTIVLTHYINPHMFWFKYEYHLLENIPLQSLELKIKNYAAEQSLDAFEPKVGQIVAFMNATWQKWIRVRVDMIPEGLDGHIYILWAIDHG